MRHELATLPYYGLFDWLEFEVLPDNTAVVRGQVVRPSTKLDAEARVREMDGVAKVINEIQVLPLSPQDDRHLTVISDSSKYVARTMHYWIESERHLVDLPFGRSETEGC